MFQAPERGGVLMILQVVGGNGCLASPVMGKDTGKDRGMDRDKVTTKSPLALGLDQVWKWLLESG
jgi:hypothetical protein